MNIHQIKNIRILQCDVSNVFNQIFILEYMPITISGGSTNITFISHVTCTKISRSRSMVRGVNPKVACPVLLGKTSKPFATAELEKISYCTSAHHCNGWDTFSTPNTKKCLCISLGWTHTLTSSVSLFLESSNLSLLFSLIFINCEMPPKNGLFQFPLLVFSLSATSLFHDGVPAHVPRLDIGRRLLWMPLKGCKWAVKLGLVKDDSRTPGMFQQVGCPISLGLFFLVVKWDSSLIIVSWWWHAYTAHMTCSGFADLST